MTDLEQAVGEALTYNRMGGLDQDVLNDIAHDFGVDPKDILEEIGWGRDYYDDKDSGDDEKQDGETEEEFRQRMLQIIITSMG